MNNGTTHSLSIQGLEVSIGGSLILRGVNLSLRPGTVFCLMGRNGVGKSTTLKTLVGLLPAEKGHILFKGQDISKLRPENRARAGIAYVPQGREIFPHLSVEENLIIGAKARGWKTKPSDLERVFTLFPIIKEFLKRKGGMLSGGQQQQLAIGRAMLTKPSLLILDEPTEGIQPNIIDQIGDAIKLLRDEEIMVEQIGNAIKDMRENDKMTILLVEQYLDFCRELGDDFAILERGSVAADGSMAELSEEIVKKYLTV